MWAFSGHETCGILKKDAAPPSRETQLFLLAVKVFNFRERLPVTSIANQRLFRFNTQSSHKEKNPEASNSPRRLS
jgi:hypothetical protein